MYLKASEKRFVLRYQFLRRKPSAWFFSRKQRVWNLKLDPDDKYIVPVTENRSVKLTNINLFPKRNLDSNQNKSKRVRMGCSQGRQLCVVLICLCVNSFPTKWRSCYYTSGQLRHYHHHHYHLSHRWHHHYQTWSLRLETSSIIIISFGLLNAAGSIIYQANSPMAVKLGGV